MLSKYPIFRAVGLLVKRPAPYSVRGLARQAKISPSAAKACLDWLFANKILTRDVIGKTYQYKLNESYFLTKHIKILHALSEISKSGIVEELTAKYPLLSICLYGSVARGEAGPESDIDLLLITRKDVRLGEIRSEKKLGPEVAYLAYTLPEWKAKSQKDRVFYERFIIDAIPLYGEVPLV